MYEEKGLHYVCTASLTTDSLKAWHLAASHSHANRTQIPVRLLTDNLCDKFSSPNPDNNISSPPFTPLRPPHLSPPVHFSSAANQPPTHRPIDPIHKSKPREWSASNTAISSCTSSTLLHLLLPPLCLLPPFPRLRPRLLRQTPQYPPSAALRRQHSRHSYY